MSAVALRGVRKAFDGVEVLHGVDAEIGDGEFVVLVGPSGSGKTTLLRVIAGLERAGAGDVLIDGRVVTGVAPKDRDVAMVFQQYALYPHLTVRENLGFSLRMRGEKRARVAARVAEVAALLGLAGHLERHPGQLSGGQQQRVAIGRAIARSPSVFLFDEPLSNLDGALRLQLRNELKALHRRLGAASIYVTHDQAEAMALADRIVVLRDGRVEQCGTPVELYDRPANAFVARFIGMPPMNLVPAEAFGDARPIVYGFRPEACAIVDAGGIAGTVASVEEMGATQHVWVDAGAATLCAASGERRRWTIGQAVHLRPDPRKVLLFDAASGRAL